MAAGRGVALACTQSFPVFVCVCVSKNIFQRVVKGFFLRCQNRQTALRHSLRGKVRGKAVRGDQGEFNFEPTNQRISLGTALISPKRGGAGQAAHSNWLYELIFYEGGEGREGGDGGRLTLDTTLDVGEQIKFLLAKYQQCAACDTDEGEGDRE